MTKIYQDLAKREKRVADELAAEARVACISALSSSLTATATALVKILLKDDGRGRISEPAQDLQALRVSPVLVQAKSSDLYQAERVVKKLLLDALKYGYEYDATERAKLIVAESDGLKIEVALTEQELKDIESFPISGMTADEWAKRSVMLLSNAIDQALAKPLTGGIDPAVIPGALSDAANTHANGVASLVKEAFFAGGKAAMLALREALSGH